KQRPRQLIQPGAPSGGRRRAEGTPYRRSRSANAQRDEVIRPEMRWVSRTRVQPRSPQERLGSLSVGERVVYGSHGLGRVAVVETKVVGGAAREVVVVELSEGLLVTLPLERALGCLRLVADDAEIEDVQNVLRGSVIDEQTWQKRLRVAHEK